MVRSVHSPSTLPGSSTATLGDFLPAYCTSYHALPTLVSADRPADPYNVEARGASQKVSTLSRSTLAPRPSYAAVLNCATQASKHLSAAALSAALPAKSPRTAKPCSIPS